VITPSQTKSKYVSIQGYLDFVRGRVRESVQNYCDEKGYAFISRIKTLQSLSEKLESGRYKRWSEVDDLIACSVVIPTLLEEDAVLDFLRSAFDQVEVRKRGSTQKSPDVFRFDTTRFIGRLRRPEHVAESEPVYQIIFEVQIRSAFEHAWSVTTHALTYKGQSISWNRLRLTAQLKAAVEQLDMLILGFEAAAAKIAPSFWPETQAKAEIAKFFKDQVEAKLIPDELSPKDWSRFSENAYAMLRASTWAKGKRPMEIATAISEKMKPELLSLGSQQVPVSISLLQFVFGAMCKVGMITPPLDERYCPIITAELEDLYPVMKSFEVRFDYSG
jgi:ppGpp synthetase/RelA/SpoT-type nucleotidyltranferase